MGPRGRRSALWLFGAVAALVLAATVRLAGVMDEPSSMLVAGIFVEAILAACAFVALRAHEADGAEAGHRPSRSAALGALRVVALLAAVAFLALAAFATLLGAPVGAGALPLLGVCIAACVVGASLEHERAPRPRRAERPARETVYTTRGGAVQRLAEGRAQGDRVQRAIDARGWTEQEKPTPERLRDALERWGRLETR